MGAGREEIRQREAGGCRRQISELEKSRQFTKIPGSSSDCCLLRRAMCVFGAQQAGWELSRNFPPILGGTPPQLLGGSHHHQGKYRHKLPLYSHKNNMDNWEGTKDENAVRKTDSPALVDAYLDPV